MKKISLYIFLVLMWCNVGFADELSEANRKNSKIKLSCKIDHIGKFADQDGTLVEGGVKIISDVDLPGFIIETNENSRPVWINKIGIKADDNWGEKLIFKKLEEAEKEDYVFINQYWIDYTDKGMKGEDFSISIDSSMHTHKKELTAEVLKENDFFTPVSTSFGGCNKIKLKDFANEEKKIDEEIRIAEEKKIIDEKRIAEEKKIIDEKRIAEGKIELNCKDGVMHKHGKEPEPFYDTINYLINLNDYSFTNLNFEADGKNYFIGTDEALVLYRFSNDVAQIGGYNRNTAKLTFITGYPFSDDVYNNIKSKLDIINEQIPNYQSQEKFGAQSYKTSGLGTQKQEIEKFNIVRSLILSLNPANITKSEYKCNKL